MQVSLPKMRKNSIDSRAIEMKIKVSLLSALTFLVISAVTPANADAFKGDDFGSVVKMIEQF